MNCQDFETLLADALGDELGSADRVAFDNHLKQCAECRRDYESATKTIGAMRSLPDHPAIPIERIGDRLVIGAASGSAPSRRFRLRRAAPIAAAIALAFASGYLARNACWEATRAPSQGQDRRDVSVSRSTQPFPLRDCTKAINPKGFGGLVIEYRA